MPERHPARRKVWMSIWLGAGAGLRCRAIPASQLRVRKQPLIELLTSDLTDHRSGAKTGLGLLRAQPAGKTLG